SVLICRSAGAPSAKRARSSIVRTPGVAKRSGAGRPAPGSLGAVGLTKLPVLADAALRGRRGMTTGANQDDFHVRGVDVERDLAVTAWHDLRTVAEGEGCPACGAPLRVAKTIEVGHIFKLGTRYSEKLGATVLDRDGKAVPLVMGSYGIGIGRTMAAVAERCHDENGLVWPMSIAPYEVVVSVLNPNDPRTSETGARLYEALRAAGVDALLDDRDERPGVKFKDAELIGIPYRLTVGPKGLEQGKVEIVRRKGGARREVDVAKAAEMLTESVMEERR
ncbi:MAG TPA: His/Gly/Thr/Pro-type tRNA ligase C-terminal domain-containing protein, partial [Myxococcota bacterium]|nr:His/Gly/Thr/Pro-type tRNA ligase C-terminal domain-containing protein [Myxococcota bacterium]